MKYPVIISKTDTGYCASSPDVPGCVSTGDTPEEVREGIASALRAHIFMEPLIGNAVPEAVTIAEMIEVDPAEIPAEEAAALRRAAQEAVRMWAEARGPGDRSA